MQKYLEDIAESTLNEIKCLQGQIDCIPNHDILNDRESILMQIERRMGKMDGLSEALRYVLNNKG